MLGSMVWAICLISSTISRARSLFSHPITSRNLCVRLRSDDIRRATGSSSSTERIGFRVIGGGSGAPFGLQNRFFLLFTFLDLLSEVSAPVSMRTDAQVVAFVGHSTKDRTRGCPRWVKGRKSHPEQIWSALPQIADIDF